MDEEIKQGFAAVMIHVEAMKLIMRETLAIALSHQTDPNSVLKSLRENIEKITEIAETAAISGEHSPEYRRWFVEQVRGVALAQLGPVQQRLLGPKREGTTH